MTPPAARNALTICTVSFHNAPHLALNWRLSDALNRDGASLRWVVAENSPLGAPDRLPTDDARFDVIAGASPDYYPNFQHAVALHGCFGRVETRFALILDPDFYIVRPNWVSTVIQYMDRQELGFLGVPWHPRLASKYRYFPAVHCFFIDTERVALGDLDFRPLGKAERSRPGDELGPEGAEEEAPKPGLLGRALGLEARRKNYVDTGTRVYRRYAGTQEVRYECALPVFRLPQDSQVSHSWRLRLLERLLPDELCYLPKRRDSYTGRGLRELGYLAGAPGRWEEFMWQGLPLGFHVRRNAEKARRDPEEELRILRRAIDEFMPETAGVLEETGESPT
ncbi:hypothetical protein [Pelagibius sp.]|uniref:hypothetical protein n=1 Tax=Pelagibius sp. TaxID=1931238 RepID=UPI00261F09F2|nr:hypothetical protein [Pelagibius sp.]